MAVCPCGGDTLTHVVVAGEIFVDLILGGLPAWPVATRSITARSSFGWTLCALAALSMIGATAASPNGSQAAFDAGPSAVAVAGGGS